MRIGLAFVLVIASVVLTAGIAGCGGGGTGTNLPDPIIRFINASPDANPLDFFINLDNKAPALTYLTDSGEVTTKKGDKDITVQDSTDQSVLDAIAFTFAQDKKYMSLAVGLQNFGTENEKRLRLFAFQFDKNPPNGSKARLLIIHAYMRQTGFQTPNIDFQNPGDNPQFKVADIAFANAQPAGLEVDSGISLVFQARRAGTENVVASDAGTTFDDGGIYLTIVSGIEGEVGAQAPKITYIKVN